MVSLSLRKLDRVSLIAGYDSPGEMILKFILPSVFVVLITAILFPMFLPIPWWSGIIVFVVGCLFIVSYPYVEFDALKRDINTNLHYFITYAGTVSTVNIPRATLFKKIAENEMFGYISNVFEKTNYLAKKWNLGYSTSLRKMVNKSPSKILADFLDRLAVTIDFGEDLKIFLREEQEAILDDYKVEYEKSLETIKLLQDTFIALTISFSFLLGVTLLAPLLMDISMETILPYAIGVIIFIDIGLIVAVNTYIPKDSLTANLDDTNKEEKEIRNAFWAMVGVGVVLFFFLFNFTVLDLLPSMATAATPLMYPGYLVLVYEEQVKRRDKQFPVFMRVLGAAIEVRDGAVVGAIKSTQVHDFGALDKLSRSMYRRLRLGSDKFKCWYYFALESGSNLISNFSKIFSESIYMGGNAQEIGEMVSTNTQHLLSLRRLRNQLAQGLRGSFYGTLIGLSAVIYITTKVSQLLVDIFNQPLGLEQGDEFSFVETLVPTAGNVNFDNVMMYIAILIIVHALASSFIMKIIDGGLWYGAVVDFVIMLWIGALISWFLPTIIDQLLPSATTFGVNNTAAAAAAG